MFGKYLRKHLAKSYLKDFQNVRLKHLTKVLNNKCLLNVYAVCIDLKTMCASMFIKPDLNLF